MAYHSSRLLQDLNLCGQCPIDSFFTASRLASVVKITICHYLPVRVWPWTVAPAARWDVGTAGDVLRILAMILYTTNESIILPTGKTTIRV